MNWTVEQWHKRFVQQASWTLSLRRYLYSQVGIQQGARILEIGCGTGALSRDFAAIAAISLHGIDIDFSRLAFAAAANPQAAYTAADAVHLPYADSTFQLVISHYLFLWLNDPAAALREMVRVVRPGGIVLALAEPDHSARIDAPGALEALGKAQTASLKLQGAHPSIGRLLPDLFSRSGLTGIQFGASGFQSPVGSLPPGWDLEWQMLGQDLAGSMPADTLSGFKNADRAAWLSGSRVLWVPTFYIYGTKNI